MQKLTNKQVEQLLNRLKGYDIIDCKLLDKGYSTDQKFILTPKEHEKLLMKIALIHDLERKKQEYHYIGVHHSNGVLCPKPLAFFDFKELNVCVMFLEYIEGNSADVVLGELNLEKQYQLGYEAGKQLKKIHLVQPDKEVNYVKERWEKYLSKKRFLIEHGITFDHQEFIEAYIESHYNLITNDEVRFVHDDFHPANIIIKNDQLEAVIDYNRFSWGDPLEEFFKLPKYTNKVSVSFSIGQLEGYFDGEIPSSFWKKYNLFIALNFHSSFIDGYKTNRMEEITERQERIFKGHDFSHDGPPKWYLEYKGEI